MALCVIILDLGLLFYILLGFRWGSALDRVVRICHGFPSFSIDSLEVGLTCPNYPFNQGEFRGVVVWGVAHATAAGHPTTTATIIAPFPPAAAKTATAACCYYSNLYYSCKP